jgi:NDP-sugar pyrophosphorylase family protein
MKYKLTKNTKDVYGATLYQIQALKDFGNVKKGDLGGWIEKEENLCQEDNCWVYGYAMVFGNAKVYGNAMVCDNAWVYGNAMVYGNAKVSGNAWVYGNSKEVESKVLEKKDVFDDLDVLSGDIEEVVIKGIRYKKVTETKITWKKIS